MRTASTHSKDAVHKAIQKASKDSPNLGLVQSFAYTTLWFECSFFTLLTLKEL
jgi:hypothetical protein